MWLFNSSIGRKLIMSLSGLFLIIFLLVHLTVNLFIYGGPEAYLAACHFMELPIVLAIVPVLALGFIVHIAYAFMLTLRNMKARGSDSYASGNKTNVAWASKNMLVLGIIVLGFLGLHLFHFWAKMQLQVMMGQESQEAYFIAERLFSDPLYSVLYIVWIAALWFHLTHGFWSAIQTIGINNYTWMPRWKMIGNIFATVVCLGFISIPLYFLFGLNV